PTASTGCCPLSQCHIRDVAPLSPVPSVDSAYFPSPLGRVPRDNFSVPGRLSGIRLQVFIYCVTIALSSPLFHQRQSTYASRRHTSQWTHSQTDRYYYRRQRHRRPRLFRTHQDRTPQPP